MENVALQTAVRHLGIPFGWYTFCRPRTNGVAERQVKHAICGTIMLHVVQECEVLYNIIQLPTIFFNMLKTDPENVYHFQK